MRLSQRYGRLGQSRRLGLREAHNRGTRFVVAALLAGGLVGLPEAALAHGDEEEVSARESVLQAVAYIVNAPDNMEMISDKLKDAEASKDQSGVNRTLVEKAMAAVDAGNMRTARTMLEQSIGAKLDLKGLDMRHVLQVPPGLPAVSLATGDQAGTQVVTDEMPGRGALSGGDAAILGLAVVSVVGGVVLSLRFRPEHSIHQLRRGAAPRPGR